MTGPGGRGIIIAGTHSGCGKTWTMRGYVEQAVEQIRAQVGGENVILGLSGGVDSSVAAALIHKAIGDQLTCIFVNNGLLRAREEEIVQRVFGENFHIKLKYVDASERFQSKLRGITDPEQKRKIIGNEFIRVFEDAISDLAKTDDGSPVSDHKFRFLAQGTLYPDVIESVSIGGNPANTAGEPLQDQQVPGTVNCHPIRKPNLRIGGLSSVP